jgi:hypothetical protein
VRSDRFYPGLQVTYYPRACKPGHAVTIVSVEVLTHRTRIRFRYADGRQREVSIQKFHTEPYVKE